MRKKIFRENLTIFYKLPSANITDCGAKFVNVTENTPYAIPTMIFSFLCHTSVLPIYAELKEPAPGGEKMLFFKYNTLTEKMKYVSMTAITLLQNFQDQVKFRNLNFEMF